MKCANCKHEKHNGPCRVAVDIPISHGNTTRGVCGCLEFVEPADMAICSNCEEPLAYSYSTVQLIPDFPYLFVCVWCVHCKHIVTSQVTVMLPPLPKGAGAPGAQSNIHIPS